MKTPNIGRTGLAAALGFAALAVAPGGALRAADVAFVGTDGELSNPANWSGGSLPGSGDVGVVTGTSALTVSEACALGGLRLDGQAEAAVIDATAELSVGAGGITSTATTGTTINGQVAVAGSQTWTFAGTLTLNAKLSGTDDLEIKPTGSITVSRAPEYGGKLTTCAPLNYAGKGKIAREFVSSHSGTEWERKWYDYVRLDGTNTWRSLFTDGTASFKGWVRSFLSAPSSAADYPYLILEDGDTLFSDNRVFGFAAGTVEQRGGTVNKNNYLLIGSQEGGVAFDVKYRLKGGQLGCNNLFIGENGLAHGKATNEVGFASGCNPTLIQDGGNVGYGASTTTRVCIGGGNGAHEESFAKWQLNGGSWCGDCISLGGRWKGDAASAQTGVFEMNGGAVTGKWLYFGHPYRAEGTARADELHGVFDIRGGTVSLTGGIGFGPWNKSATNATYRFTHSGGEISFAGGDKTIKAGIGIGAFGTGAAWSVAAGDTVTLDAPLAGSGDFTKRGAGTLVLTDANRYSGALTVEAGEVVVKGGLQGTAATAAFSAPDGFVEWTADEATAVADGDAVAAWPSVDGTKTILPYGDVAAPKLVRNAVNGHSAIRYDGNSVLYLPKKESDFVWGTPTLESPLWTAVAVVFRTREEGTGTKDNGVRDSVGLVSSRSDATLDAPNLCDMSVSFCSRGTVASTWTTGERYRCTAWSLRPMQLHDGMPHVAVMRTKFNGRYDQGGKNTWGLNKTTLTVDGRATSATCNFGNGFDARDTFIGSLTETVGRFKGEILAVALCANEMTDEQALALSERYAERYGFTLETYLPSAGGNADENGINPRGIEVKPGASLRVAYASVPTKPWTPTALSRVSGAVTFDFSAVADDVKRAMADVASLTLARLPSGCTVEADAEWKVAGLSRGYRVEYDEDTGDLRLVRLGFALILR